MTFQVTLSEILFLPCSLLMNEATGYDTVLKRYRTVLVRTGRLFSTHPGRKLTRLLLDYY